MLGYFLCPFVFRVPGNECRMNLEYSPHFIITNKTPHFDIAWVDMTPRFNENVPDFPEYMCKCLICVDLEFYDVRNSG